ncbi:proteasome assembly chaperone family protein [Methanomicrobium antiquum]|uniref:Proteasome assembly chaperone family protein n=1 Tax=Methanomicrobium antiquum TaxID=487686 RepID=A0AAF0FT82_9EURY|nr:proteasome assembly chaperone family protein [Methanomicrobium antiquum]MDD3976643.1 proteasome assembly chaperone family protein [Methanomicrobium sp.]WFN37711.1 proteasome assembly chaperone family protein [Methanomicrobium antiquum]
MGDIKVISEAPKGEEITALMGFPGSGLVGSISTQYLVDNGGFEYIGSITSKYFPPVAMMVDGVINAPIRIYSKDSYVAFVSDIPIHTSICYEVTTGILEWLNGHKLKQVVILAGIITNTFEKRVFGVASEPAYLETLKDKTEILPMGSISGMPGSLLTECKTLGIPAIGFLGETINAPDPRSSVSVLNVLNDVFHFNVDVEPLLEQAEEIEASMQKMAEQVRQSENQQDVPKKEHLPMYG